MCEIDQTQLLKHAAEAVEAAGRALLGALAGRPQSPEFQSWAQFKLDFDQLDGLGSAIVHERLSTMLPEADWADELGTELPTHGDVWVLDALDGAIQYIQGLPGWSVSLALVSDGEVALAVLHNPLSSETYTATLGGGAHLNGTPVTPSVKTDLAITLVTTSQPPFVAKQPNAVEAAARATATLLPKIGVLRNFGPTSWQVAEVASGRIDAFWEYGQDAANLIAGALLVKEAGGEVSDTTGNPWHPAADSFLAAPASLHAELVKALAHVTQHAG